MSGFGGPGGPHGGQQPGGWGGPQQPGPYGQPQPYGQQYGGPGAPGPYPGGPGGPPRERTGAGIALAVVVAAVCTAVYAYIVKEADDDPRAYLAVLIGGLTGFVAGKVGGRSGALPVVAAVLTAAATYFGWYFGIALALSDVTGASVSEVIDHVDIFKAIEEGVETAEWVFLALGAVVAFGCARLAGRRP